MRRAPKPSRIRNNQKKQDRSRIYENRFRWDFVNILLRHVADAVSTAYLATIEGTDRLVLLKGDQ